MLVPSQLNKSVYVKTDPSRRLFVECSSELNTSGNNSARYYSIQPGIRYIPVSTLKLSASFNYSNSRNDLQYITTATNGSADRYILGRIEQHTMGVTLRVDYNITPEVSMQYYGSPFATVGKYSDFKRVVDPVANKYENRFAPLKPTLNGNAYQVSENGNASHDYDFTNPDFDFSQFRSNLVFRWEYRPGSQVNFVWSQDRTSYVQPGGQTLSNGISGLGDLYPNNIFLIKFNYWFSI
jgi:hypothetical protein